MDKISPFIYNIFSRVSGQAFDPLWQEKAPFIIRGTILLFVFVVVFYFLYRHFFPGQTKQCWLFWSATGGVAAFIISKYVLFHFAKGYIPDRFFFYALPSPRAQSLWWFIFPVIIFSVFLYLRKRIENLKPLYFLCSLWLFFIIFSLSVAATRGGIFSIYEPFTRIYWEYTGNLPLVHELGLRNFIGSYISLQDKLAIHSFTHPPGYTVLLFLWQKYLDAGLLGLSVLVVVLGGAALFPIYYFFRNFISEHLLRRGLQLFIFLSSMILMSATSMEATFVFFCWLSIAALYEGWKRNALLSYGAGVLVALALFQNFLFLLLAPFFLFLFLHCYFQTEQKSRLIWRVCCSFLGFLSFFIILQLATHYSIIDHVLAARRFNATWIESNFKSLPIYAVYLFMNICAFAFYLGVANVALLAPRLKTFFTWKNSLLASGFALVVLFSAVGIFQGEVERIWLFLTPLFILPLALASADFEDKSFSLLLALSFFQIILVQVCFYTYW